MRRKPQQAQVRVQRCGKSAPAASRGAGLVNPGQEQGEGKKVGHLPDSTERAARGCRQRQSQIDDHPHLLEIVNRTRLMTCFHPLKTSPARNAHKQHEQIN